MSVIVIDEVEAKTDIRRIQNALPELQAAKAALEKVKEEGMATKGETGKAIVEKSVELIQRINKLMNSLKSTAEEIGVTVQQNKLLDQEQSRRFSNLG